MLKQTRATLHHHHRPASLPRHTPCTLLHFFYFLSKDSTVMATQTPFLYFVCITVNVALSSIQHTKAVFCQSRKSDSDQVISCREVHFSTVLFLTSTVIPKCFSLLFCNCDNCLYHLLLFQFEYVNCSFVDILLFFLFNIIYIWAYFFYSCGGIHLKADV